ncbi:MAG: ISNCY family transposase [Bacilli bacterium]
MRKVVLSMKEHNTYEIIINLVEKQGDKKRVALKIGCTIRSVNRYIIQYKEHGKEAFSHKNKGLKPSITLPSELKSNFLSLYDGKYQNANFKHFNKLLKERENVSISYSALYNLLSIENLILSPKAERRTRKKASILAKQASIPVVDILSDTNDTKSNQVPLEDSHPRLERSKYFGEIIQMDASNHLWFGESKSQLHLAIDDATSHIVGGYFDYQETLNGYYNVLNDILINYGIPAKFFTDNRTVFNYFKDGVSSADRDTFTQFSYACNQLGIDIMTSSVAQAKGRIERSFQTHQSRLIMELRLASITTIEGANEYLKQYITAHNKEFALQINNNNSVFEKVEDTSKLNYILAVIELRKVDNGNSIKYKNEYYQPYLNGRVVTL